MNDINNLFFELIRVAIGTQGSLSRRPSDKEWKELFEMAKKQSLVGVCFAGVQKLAEDDRPLGMLYLQWMGLAAKIQQRNEVMNQRCVELQERLAKDGFKSCVLKGQGVAALYGELGKFRQSGDIDVWCPDTTIPQLVEYVKGLGLEFEAKHAHVSFEPFDGIEVEMHPTPASLRCPWHNRRLQKWLKGFDVEGFDKSCGFVVPSREFNLVYLMLHIYHHMLFEGVGLRQVMDYFFVLRNTNYHKLSARSASACGDALLAKNYSLIFKNLGMGRFASALMWVLGRVFGLERDAMLCDPDEEGGKMLLREIMAGGNFGHYDERYKEQQSRNLFVHGFGNMKKKWPMLRVAFWEVVCSPFWSLWQIAWRKRNGYV